MKRILITVLSNYKWEIVSASYSCPNWAIPINLGLKKAQKPKHFQEIFVLTMPLNLIRPGAVFWGLSLVWQVFSCIRSYFFIQGQSPLPPGNNLTILTALLLQCKNIYHFYISSFHNTIIRVFFLKPSWAIQGLWIIALLSVNPDLENSLPRFAGLAFTRSFAKSLTFS